MTTKTSSSGNKSVEIRRKTLYRKALEEGSGLGLFAVALSFLSLVLPTLLRQQQLQEVWFNVRGVYLSSGQYILSMVATAFLTIGTAFFYQRHIFSRQGSDFYHSQPQSRGELFNGRALAGFTWVLGPFVIFYFLTFLIQLLFFGNIQNLPESLPIIARDFISMIVYQISLYWFITACAMQAGTMIQGVALAGFGGFLLLGFFAVLLSLQDRLLYGSQIQSNFLMFLSPYTYIFYSEFYSGLGAMGSVGVSWLVIGYGVILAALFYGISHKSYRNRPSEIAGESESFGLSLRIMEGFVTFIVIFLSLQIFWDIQFWLSLPLSLGIGILAGYLLDLLLGRGQIRWRKTLGWLGGAAALFVLLFAVFFMDPMGYTQRVPQVEDVESVSINHSPYQMGYTTYAGEEISLHSPQAVQTLVDTHQAIVDTKPEFSEDYSLEYLHHGFEITYRLKNGRTLSRRFSNIHFTAAEKFAMLAKVPEYHQHYHILNRMEEVGVDLSSLVQSISLSDNLSQKTLAIPLDKAKKTQLLRALVVDIGNTDSLEVLEKPAQLLLTLSYRQSVYEEHQKNYQRFGWYSPSSYPEDIPLTSGYENTLALLKSWGYEKEKGELVTLPPTQAMVYSREYYDSAGEIFVHQPLVFAINTKEAKQYLESNSLHHYQTQDKKQVEFLLENSTNAGYVKVQNDPALEVLFFTHTGEYAGSRLLSQDRLPQGTLEQWGLSFDDLDEGTLYARPVFS